MLPDWIDQAEYPFEPDSQPVNGGRMYYVDEGRGTPVVMVHGTPTWSFLYRHLIRGLSNRYRTIAPDHIGFGLSDKPEEWSYRPEDHAQNIGLLIEALELEDIVLVVHDFGGPIGLSYAVEHPNNVSRLILFNTWMWPIDNTFARLASRLFASPLGRLLYKRFNFSPRVMLRAAWGDKTELTPEIHRAYLRPFPSKAHRQGPWVLTGELTDSAAWYEKLWNRRQEIANKPALLIWGEKDPAFGEEYLDRWKEVFVESQTVVYPGAGHFVPEEVGSELVPVVKKFLEAADI